MLLDLAIKSLWRRRLRSLLTVLGVAVALQLYITMDGIMSWYNADMQAQLSAFAGKVYIQQHMETADGGQDFPSTSSSIPLDDALAVLKLEGVNRSASSPVLFSALALSGSPNSVPSLLGVGLEPGHETSLLSGVIAETGTLALNDPHSVILGASAASHYQAGNGQALQVGQTIQVRGQTFIVAGILKSSSQLFNGLVIMPLVTAQELFNRPDTVSAVVLTTSSMDAVSSLKRAIRQQYPRLETSSPEDLARNAQAMLANQNTFFALINDTVLLVAIVAITIVVFIAVMEQRKEIGTLRAIGARRWRIFSLVAAEAVSLSLLGAFVALPLALIMAKTVLAHVTRQIAGTYSTWLTGLGLSLVIGLLAALLPAWLAVRVDPLEALRYE